MDQTRSEDLITYYPTIVELLEKPIQGWINKIEN